MRGEYFVERRLCRRPLSETVSQWFWSVRLDLELAAIIQDFRAGSKRECKIAPPRSPSQLPGSPSERSRPAADATREVVERWLPCS